MDSMNPANDPTDEFIGEPHINEPRIDKARVEEAFRRLTDPDRDVRYAAALDLGTTTAPSAAQALVTRLGTEQDFFVRDTLAWALTRIPDTATPLLLNTLTGTTPGTGTRTNTQARIQALHVLSKIADTATTNTILTLTADPDPGVAAKARWALTRIADPVAIPALAVHLGTGDSTTQNDLTRDLASFGTAAIPHLTTALADKEANVRAHAAEVLCFIGPDAADATDDLTRALKDPVAEVRFCVAMALYEISTPAAQEALSHHTEADDPRLRAIARRAHPKTVDESYGTPPRPSPPER